jgi:cysteine-rich repeat protein
MGISHCRRGSLCLLQCLSLALAACSGSIGSGGPVSAASKDAGSDVIDAGNASHAFDASNAEKGDAAIAQAMEDAAVSSSDASIPETTAEPSANAAVCGNGQIERGEACDDGNSVDDDYCSNDCRLPGRCGDHVRQAGAGEACDDGNTVTETCQYAAVSCEVCAADCELAAGATSRCGDGTVQTNQGEQCDDGNVTTEACAYGAASCSVCDASCHSVAGATQRCGDGHIDAAHGEQCDDGGTQAGYGCSATCQVEAVASCGNSTIDTGENCDDGNRNNLDGCNAACKKETGWNCPTAGTACTPICGDSALVGNEVCDDGNTVDTDYCSNNCQVKRRCGDAAVQASAGEQCDDGNTTTEACSYGQQSCTVCNASCKNQAGTTSYCGDGVVDASHGEDCDVANDIRCVSCKLVCDTVYITYATTGSFQVTDTTANAGNGTYAQTGGSLIMAFTAGATGPVNGAASLLYVKAPVKFTTTISLGGTTTITTDLLGTAGTTGNRCPLNSGTLDTSSAQVAWGVCPFVGWSTSSWTPTAQQVAAGAGPGCLQYNSTGTMACSGAQCSAAGVPSGVNQMNQNWDQPAATYEFQNSYANVKMRALGLGTHADGPGNKVEIPNTTNGRTWVNFDGVESARSCGWKPSGCPAPGAQ